MNRWMTFVFSGCLAFALSVPAFSQPTPAAQAEKKTEKKGEKKGQKKHSNDKKKANPK